MLINFLVVYANFNFKLKKDDDKLAVVGSGNIVHTVVEETMAPKISKLEVSNEISFHIYWSILAELSGYNESAILFSWKIAVLGSLLAKNRFSQKYFFFKLGNK